MGRPVEVPSYRSGPYQVELRPRDASAPGYRAGPYLVRVRLHSERPAKPEGARNSGSALQAPADRSSAPRHPAPARGSVADQLAAVTRAVGSLATDSLVLDEDPLIEVNACPVLSRPAVPMPTVRTREAAADDRKEETKPKARAPSAVRAAVTSEALALSAGRTETIAERGATEVERSRGSLLLAAVVAGCLLVWTGSWPQHEDLLRMTLAEVEGSWARSQPALERLYALLIEVGLVVPSAGEDHPKVANESPPTEKDEVAASPSDDAAVIAVAPAPFTAAPDDSEPLSRESMLAPAAGAVAEAALSENAALARRGADVNIGEIIPSGYVVEVARDPEPSSSQAPIAIPQHPAITDRPTSELASGSAPAEPQRSIGMEFAARGKRLTDVPQVENERFFVQFGSFRSEAVAHSDCATFKGLAEVRAISGRDGALWYVCRTPTSKDREYGLGLIGTVEAAMHLKAVLIPDRR